MSKYKIKYFKSYDDIDNGILDDRPYKTEIFEGTYGEARIHASNNLDKYGAVCAKTEIY